MGIKSSIDAVTFSADEDRTIATTATRRRISDTEDEWVFNLHQLVEGQIVEGLPFEASVKTQDERDSLGKALVQALLDRRKQVEEATQAFGRSLIDLVPAPE